MTPGRRKALDASRPLDALIDRAEQLKASIRAKVEQPFRASTDGLAARRRATAAWLVTPRR